KTTHPIRKSASDDLAFAASSGLARDGAHFRRFLGLVCPPDTEAPVTPEGAERLAHTQDCLAAGYPAGTREDVLVVFTQRLNAVFVEIKIECRLPAECIIGNRCAA